MIFFSVFGFLLNTQKYGQSFFSFFFFFAEKKFCTKKDKTKKLLNQITSPLNIYTHIYPTHITNKNCIIKKKVWFWGKSKTIITFPFPRFLFLRFFLPLSKDKQEYVLFTSGDVKKIHTHTKNRFFSVSSTIRSYRHLKISLGMRIMIPSCCNVFFFSKEWESFLCFFQFSFSFFYLCWKTTKKWWGHSRLFIFFFFITKTSSLLFLF